MTDQREFIAWSLAKSDPHQQGQINDSDFGIFFWEKYREHYLVMADALIKDLVSQDHYDTLNWIMDKPIPKVKIS